MTKTLEELGLDYMKEVNVIEKKIDSYRERLKKAMKDSNRDEVFTVQRLLRVFYRQKYELLDSARVLLNYYS